VVIRLDLNYELNERKELVEDYLDGIFSAIDQHTLRSAIEHLPNAGGKRLRPICSILSCEMFQGDVMDGLPFAVALELVHNFTLIHDDIMDEDDLRRGVPTVHKAYDVATAINAGDGLYSHAFMVLSDMPGSDKLFRRLVSDIVITVRTIGEGQQDDIDFEDMEFVDLDSYMTMIEKKTAIIFDLACEGGALIAGAGEEEAQMLGDYGRYFGIAFQVLDDYLDLVSTEKTLGKPIGTDLRKGKKTLLLVSALNTAGKEDAEVIKGIWGNPEATEKDIELVRSIMERAGVMESIKSTGYSYIEKAKKSLASFPDSGPKRILLSLADYNLGRKY